MGWLYVSLERFGLAFGLSLVGATLLAVCIRREAGSGSESRAKLTGLALKLAALFILLPWLRPLANLATPVIPVDAALEARLPHDVRALGGAARDEAPELNLLSVLGGVWVVLVASGLGRLSLQARALRTLARRGEPLDAALRALVDEVALSAMVSAPRAVLSAEASVPFVFGALAPTLVIPKGLRTRLDPDAWRWVLRHELIHIQRGDPRSRLMAQLLEVLLPLNPAARLLVQEHAQACEELVDARVAALGPHAYASTLLAVAEEYALAPSHSPLVAVSTPSLTRRIHMLTGSSKRIARIFPALAVTCVLAVGVLAAPRVEAESASSMAKPTLITLVKDGKMTVTRKNLTRASVEDPSLADVKVRPDGAVELTGLKAGETRLILWSGKTREDFRVIVK